MAAVEAVVGLCLLAGTALADPVGSLLLIVAGAAVLAVGLRDLVLRPVLAADAAGLTVVDGWRRRNGGWPEVGGLAVVTDRRTPLLSLEVGGALVVLSRRRLGAAPTDVLAALEDLRNP